VEIKVDTSKHGTVSHVDQKTLMCMQMHFRNDKCVVLETLFSVIEIGTFLVTMTITVSEFHYRGLVCIALRYKLEMYISKKTHLNYTVTIFSCMMVD
jgi:hypothetical protein